MFHNKALLKIRQSIDPSDTRAIRALNRKIRDDHRVEACLLTVGDGVMVARKR